MTAAILSKSIEELSLGGKNDMDSTWVTVENEDVSSVSDWESPQSSPRLENRPPIDLSTGVKPTAANNIVSLIDAGPVIEKAPATSPSVSAVQVAARPPASLFTNERSVFSEEAVPPAPKPSFNLKTEYLHAELESVTELSKDRTYKVALKTDCADAKPLQMFVGDSEGRALVQAYRGRKWQSQGCRRPLTYDFLKEVVEALGRKVDFVRVSASERGVFYARAHFSTPANGVPDMASVEGVDCRPSDALNLALRAEADLFVHRGLVMEAP